MQTVTYKAKLLEYETDLMGYVTYVFENLNYTNLENQYIMCTRFPNWDHRILNIDDIGYLTIRFVEAGVDVWFDGNNFNPYKFTNIIFCKFIKYVDNRLDNKIILD